jgi:hypothetical protein
LSIQFSRSIRSLNIDSFRASRIGLIIGSLLMLTLILWFFFARVSVHETSQEVSLSQDGRALATFSEDALTRIQLGQDTLVRVFSSTDEPPLTIQGVVFDIFPDSNQVEITIVAEDFLDIPATDNINAQVDIEIEQVTPFNLIMRYSGQFVESEQVGADSQTESSASTP